MKTCRDIEMLLPFYSEGDLSEEDKRAVCEHLAVCEKCRTELAYLKKSGELVTQLPPVEEPPWFRQKIMAQVRKEAEQKSAAKKWFYPLRFRIPLQIAATVVIAVLAVYIYRSDDDRMKQVVTGVRPPVVEMNKEETKPQPSAATDMAAPRVKAVLPRREVQQDRGVQRETAGEKAAEQSPEFKSRLQAVDETNNRYADDMGEKKAETFPVSEGQPRKQISAKGDLSSVSGAVGPKEQVMEAEVSDRKDKEADDRALVGAGKREAYKPAAPAAPRSMAASIGLAQPSVSISLRVKNVAASVVDIEKILENYGANLTLKQVLPGRTILRIILPAKSKPVFLSKLGDFGQVAEKKRLSDEKDQNIVIILEVIPF